VTESGKSETTHEETIPKTMPKLQFVISEAVL